MDEHVEDETQPEGIAKEVDMPENEPSIEYGYAGPTHGDVRRMVLEALHKREKDRLRHLVHDRCTEGILLLFQQAQERAIDNVYTRICKVLAQEGVNAFLTEGAEELFDEKMYRLAEIQDYKQDFFRHLINSSTITVLAVGFVQKQTEKSVASQAGCTQENIRELIVKEQVTPPSPLIVCFPEFPKTSKDDKQET